MLTFHRGSYVIDVAYDVTNAGTAPIAPYAYFQFTRDTKTQGMQNSMAPVVVHRAGHLQRDRQVQEGRIRRARQGRRRSERASRRTRKNADNGWVGMVEHYFVAAWLPPDEPKTPREFYTRKLDNGLYAAGVIVPAAADRARRDRRHQGAALRRPAGPGHARKRWPRVSISSSTTASSPSSRRRCSGCSSGCTALVAQLGLGDHRC